MDISSSFVPPTSNQVMQAYQMQKSDDDKADFGLQDRDTADERVSSVQELQQRVVENHGFVAKHNDVEALTHNTKIINIPPQQRGSLLNMHA